MKVNNIVVKKPSKRASTIPSNSDLPPSTDITKNDDETISPGEALDLNSSTSQTIINKIQAFDLDHWEMLKLKSITKATSGDRFWINIYNISSSDAWKYCRKKNDYHSSSEIYFYLNQKGVFQTCRSPHCKSAPNVLIFFDPLLNAALFGTVNPKSFNQLRAMESSPYSINLATTMTPESNSGNVVTIAERITEAKNRMSKVTTFAFFNLILTKQLGPKYENLRKFALKFATGGMNSVASAELNGLKAHKKSMKKRIFAESQNGEVVESNAKYPRKDQDQLLNTPRHSKVDGITWGRHV